MLRGLLMIFGCVVLAGIGFAGGYLATQQTEVADPHAEDEAAEDDGAIPVQTLKNLGVSLKPAATASYVRYRNVQAVVMDRPQNLRTVTAPLGGLVVAVAVEPGAVVEAGAPMATVARDVIPRPKPEMTAELLLPISEDVHAAAAQLRSALGQLAITEREITRLRSFDRGGEDGALPVIAKGKLIQLGYDRERTQQQIDIARRELRRHGVSDKQVQEIEEGGHVPHTTGLWKRVLTENGFWTKRAQRLQGALPEQDRDAPWAIAIVGELAAAGLATDELATILEEVPAAGRRFSEVAGLLLQGTPPATVRLLAEQGALEGRHDVRAPTDGPEDWDVATLHVRPGQRVEAGGKVADLHDARTVWLRIEPIGSEIAALQRALTKGRALHARSLVPGAGPDLEGVHLSRIVTKSDDAREVVGYATVVNRPLAKGREGMRSWALRPGTRYMVRVPVAEYSDRFVLPIDAVTDEGPNRVVFLQDGGSFRSVPVHVEHETDEVAVIANDGSLMPGDPVVVGGALALSLALRKGKGDAGGHGHSHN